ncbi:hypothetical protein JK358_09365 [Nocardia sp. 2]|uniref:Uncharacterized protein n=1 Tax=Nocardia acididurans TaxID=2802282 RepID=A0ABS1M487_9NOCA|nr:hypothetical protein [Nocardia acididurans]MBL1074604.1 hypothetical protein [Nocardia acididurans]
MPLDFGIYAASQVGRDTGKPDDPAAIDRLVRELQGPGSFIIREYLSYLGDPADPDKSRVLRPEARLHALTMPDPWYTDRRHLDLVLCYLPETADLPGWLAFIDRVIARYGHLARYLQITLEPNFPIPWIDGISPGVLDALVHGIPHARRTLDAAGYPDVAVGFSVAEPAEWLGGDDPFWTALAAIPPADFATHIDYIGLALYPDAFSPVPAAALPARTREAIHHLRETRLPAAHLGREIPIHIFENGTPTTPDRSPADQATRLESMIRTIAARAAEANITVYELFGLRDADSARNEPLTQLAITTDDYTPKPAYTRYRDLIAEFGLT